MQVNANFINFNANRYLLELVAEQPLCDLSRRERRQRAQGATQRDIAVGKDRTDPALGDVRLDLGLQEQVGRIPVITLQKAVQSTRRQDLRGLSEASDSLILGL